jgi:hypothetical protein
LHRAVNIGGGAFASCYSLTNAVISQGVVSIGNSAFSLCRLTRVALPGSVSAIGQYAFQGCTLLTNVILGVGVTNIGSYAFYDCSGLDQVYFRGNAPSPTNDTTVFNDAAASLIVYFLPGTTGWSSTFDGLPSVLWNPAATALSTAGGHLAFQITGPANATLIVEGCTNLANPVWLPVSTNALSAGGTSAFTDLQSGNYPQRFYRFRAP